MSTHSVTAELQSRWWSRPTIWGLWWCWMIWHQPARTRSSTVWSWNWRNRLRNHKMAILRSRPRRSICTGSMSGRTSYFIFLSSKLSRRTLTLSATGIMLSGNQTPTITSSNWIRYLLSISYCHPIPLPHLSLLWIYVLGTLSMANMSMVDSDSIRSGCCSNSHSLLLKIVAIFDLFCTLSRFPIVCLEAAIGMLGILD